jgi:hypothetical protein
MNNEDTRLRVDEIYDTIKTLQKELDDLRGECSHLNYNIGYTTWRSGNMDISKICSHCSENLGVASKEEKEEFLKKEV